jgi:hypothetical protein
MNPPSQQIRVVKKLAVLTCLALLFATAAADADLPRTPVKGIPRVLGRDIERFVLLSPIVVNRSKPNVRFVDTIMVRMVPGTFIPVTEDAGGIFYQAANDFMQIRGNRPIAGGVYVSKSRPGVIWVYVGDAEMGGGVEKDTQPLPASALSNLKVAKAERNK